MGSSAPAVDDCLKCRCGCWRFKHWRHGIEREDGLFGNFVRDNTVELDLVDERRSEHGSMIFYRLT